MSDLVKHLCEAEHPLEVSLRPARTVGALKDCLDRGFVLIRFTDTRGGTELGVPVDVARSDLSSADFVNETGRVRLVGDLTLDYVNVRCTADIELPALTGHGHLDTLVDVA